MDRHYHINLFWSAPDACWVADFPDLPGCSALGDTPEEALAEARIALDVWIEAMEANGLEVPTPRYRPEMSRAA